MTLAGLIGAAAGTCSTLAYLPQVYRAWHRRSTADISLVMFVVMALGASLWLAYGFMLDDMPIIATNVASLVLMLAVVVAKIRFG